MIPIRYYTLWYTNTDGVSTNVSTTDNSTLYIDLNGLVLNQQYAITVTSINNGIGPLNYITDTVIISKFSCYGFF